MKKSKNYGMNLPQMADQYNLEHWNDNTETIDKELKKLSDQIGSEGGSSIQTQINALDESIKSLDESIKSVEETVETLGDVVNELGTNKQDKLTFDEEPTEDSSNPVTSDGVYKGIRAIFEYDEDTQILKITTENVGE